MLWRTPPPKLTCSFSVSPGASASLHTYERRSHPAQIKKDSQAPASQQHLGSTTDKINRQKYKNPSRPSRFVGKDSKGHRGPPPPQALPACLFFQRESSKGLAGLSGHGAGQDSLEGTKARVQRSLPVVSSKLGRRRGVPADGSRHCIILQADHLPLCQKRWERKELLKGTKSESCGTLKFDSREELSCASPLLQTHTEMELHSKLESNIMEMFRQM